MQTNKTTNVILGIIALALVVIIILLVTRKSRTPAIVQNEPNIPMNTQSLTTQNSGTSTLVAQTQPVVSSNASAQAYAPAPVAASKISNPDSVYPALVQNAQNQPANFDGHYEIVTGRCGMGCQTSYLFDKNTGMLYDFPSVIFANDNNYDAGPTLTNYSISGNMFTITKTNSAGVTYSEKWSLTANGFVKVQ